MIWWQYELNYICEVPSNKYSYSHNQLHEGFDDFAYFPTVNHAYFTYKYTGIA